MHQLLLLLMIHTQLYFYRMPRKFRLSIPKKRCSGHSAAASLVATASLPVSIPMSLVSALTVSVPLTLSLPSASITLIQCSESLIVSLPLSHYLEGPVESFQSLEERLKTSRLLPSSTRKVSHCIVQLYTLLFCRLEPIVSQ